MGFRFAFWLTTFVLAMVYWFISNLDRGDYNYHLFPNLINETTGQRLKIKDVKYEEIIYEKPDYINETTPERRLYDLLNNAGLLFIFPNDQLYSDPQDQAVSGWPVANQALCDQQLNWIIGKLIENPHYTRLKGQLGDEMTKYMDTFGQFQSGSYRGDHISVGNYKYCLQSKLQNGNIHNRYCLARFRINSWPSKSYASPPPTLSYGICLPETCDTNSYPAYKESIEFLTKYQFPEYYKENLVFDNLFCLPDDRSPIRKIKPIGYLTLAIMLSWTLMILSASLIYEYIIRRQQKRLEACLSSQNGIVINNEAGDQKTNQIQLNIMHNHVNNNYNINSKNDKDTKSQQHSTNMDIYEGGYKNSIEHVYEKNNWEKLIEGLALRYSIKTFKTCNFRVRYDRGEKVKVDLSPLDFIKSCFIFAIIFGHAYLFGGFYAKHLRGRIDFTNSDASKTGISIGRFVDTFFVFFGILSTFTLLRKLNINQLSNPIFWIMSNVGVYLRIVPVYVLMYMFNRTIMPYIGSGPFWDYGVERLLLRHHCLSEPWIKVLPPFGMSGNPAVSTCNPPSWFLVSYTQITLFLPLLSYILHRLPKFTHKVMLIGFLCLLSASNIGYRLYVQQVVSTKALTELGGKVVTLIDKYEASGYMDTLTRLGSVAAGSFTGYLLYQYLLGRIEKWPWWITSRYAIFANLLGHIFIYCLPLLAIRLYRWTGIIVPIEQFVIGNMIAYMLWAFLNVTLIISLVTVYAKHVIVRFMSHPVWHSFNKLGLTILLVQYEIVMYAWLEVESGPTQGFIIDVLKVGCFGTFFSILIAFYIYIFVEAPITHLVMSLMGPMLLGKSCGYNTEQKGEIDQTGTVDKLE